MGTLHEIILLWEPIPDENKSNFRAPPLKYVIIFKTLFSPPPTYIIKIKPPKNVTIFQQLNEFLDSFLFLAITPIDF